MEEQATWTSQLFSKFPAMQAMHWLQSRITSGSASADRVTKIGRHPLDPTAESAKADVCAASAAVTSNAANHGVLNDLFHILPSPRAEYGPLMLLKRTPRVGVVKWYFPFLILY